jgi:hypothetical protein
VSPTTVEYENEILLFENRNARIAGKRRLYDTMFDLES